MSSGEFDFSAAALHSADSGRHCHGVKRTIKQALNVSVGGTFEVSRTGSIKVEGILISHWQQLNT